MLKNKTLLIYTFCLLPAFLFLIFTFFNLYPQEIDLEYQTQGAEEDEIDVKSVRRGEKLPLTTIYSLFSTKTIQKRVKIPVVEVKEVVVKKSPPQVCDLLFCAYVIDRDGVKWFFFKEGDNSRMLKFKIGIELNGWLLKEEDVDFFVFEKNHEIFKVGK